tara:strand:- start:930 stop:1127 length:198 start_codon:yes stop_codon:yes gene_type:complete
VQTTRSNSHELATQADFLQLPGVPWDNVFIPIKNKVGVAIIVDTNEGHYHSHPFCFIDDEDFFQA